LEILPDGYGFLRSPDYNYLPGPTTSTSARARSSASTCAPGDTISGQVRPPKEGERYFALLRVEGRQLRESRVAKTKTLFDNLTPLYPRTR
jgi:transcription termination factor Rho